MKSSALLHGYAVPENKQWRRGEATDLLSQRMLPDRSWGKYLAVTGSFNGDDNDRRAGNDSLKKWKSERFTSNRELVLGKNQKWKQFFETL